MNRTLDIDPADAVPIWKQIEDGVAHLIASAALRPGDAVPSVRDLAKELRVNPATVAKAYQRLSDSGFLEVKRGEGTFVAGEPPSFGRGERVKLLREAAQKYSVTATNLGAGIGEAVDEVRSALNRLRPAPEGGKA